MASIVYRSVLGYELAMRMLYGRHYSARFHAVADLIPARATVLDVCCGPALLYRRCLHEKGVDYEGVDVSARFVDSVRALGARGRVVDLHEPTSLPAAEYVVMQGSLYQFLPDAARMVDMLLESATNTVIVAEPVRNLAESSNPVVGVMARRFSNAGRGPELHRFTERSLDELFAPYESAVTRSFLIPGGREKVFVLAK